MTTDELYQRMTASTLARIYLDIEMSDVPGDMAEAKLIWDAGLANCGENDFRLLVDEVQAEFNR